jgi:ketosteroid isomerase-like protein
MNANEQIMHRFYTAFSKLDYATMQDCYHEDAVFSDPAFGLLNGDEVRAMWEMLCKRAKDFKLQFSNIASDDHEYSTCSWRAEYVFSKTGRRVENYVKGYMRFAEGKIIEHSDAFSLHRWAAQALGFKGWLFGGFGFFQKKVQRTSRKVLKDYMEQMNR